MKDGWRKRSRCTNERSRFGAKPGQKAPPISRNRTVISPWFTIRAAISPALRSHRESLRNWESMEKPSQDYQIVASNYADLLRSLGKKRKAAAIESRARRRGAR